MMNTKIVTTLLGGFFALALVACSEKKAAPETSTGGAQKTCPVSGEELGSMGDPVVVMHEGKEIKLCCDSCLPKFNADPAKFAALVAEKTGQ
jgi:hypothetical protein